MRADVTQHIREFMADHERRKRLVVIVAMLSICTVFAVFGALLRPAISMESDSTEAQEMATTSDTSTNTGIDSTVSTETDASASVEATATGTTSSSVTEATTGDTSGSSNGDNAIADSSTVGLLAASSTDGGVGPYTVYKDSGSSRYYVYENGVKKIVYCYNGDYHQPHSETDTTTHAGGTSGYYRYDYFSDSVPSYGSSSTAKQQMAALLYAAYPADATYLMTRYSEGADDARDRTQDAVWAFTDGTFTYIPSATDYYTAIANYGLSANPYGATGTPSISGDTTLTKTSTGTYKTGTLTVGGNYTGTFWFDSLPDGFAVYDASTNAQITGSLASGSTFYLVYTGTISGTLSATLSYTYNDTAVYFYKSPDGLVGSDGVPYQNFIRLEITGKTGSLTLTGTETTPVTPTYSTNLTATKTWSDGAAKHTEGSVTVHILADNVDTGYTLTLNAANSWTATYEGLPYYKSDGKTSISYTISEDLISGYTATYGSVTSTAPTYTWTRKTSISTSQKSGDTSTFAIRSTDGTKALGLTENSDGTYSLKQMNYDASDTSQQWSVSYTSTNSYGDMGFNLINAKYPTRMLHFNNSAGIMNEYFDTVAAGSISNTDTSVVFYYHTATTSGNLKQYGLYTLNKYGGTWYYKYISSTGSLTIGGMGTVTPVTIYEENSTSTPGTVNASVTNTPNATTAVTVSKLWGNGSTKTPVSVKLFRSSMNNYKTGSTPDPETPSTGTTHAISFTNNNGGMPTSTVTDGNSVTITITYTAGNAYYAGGLGDATTKVATTATYTMGSKTGTATVKGFSFDSDTSTWTLTYQIDDVTADTAITLLGSSATWFNYSQVSFQQSGSTSDSGSTGGSSTTPSSTTQVTIPDGASLVDTQTLSASNNWTYTWSNLDKGYTYYVQEVVPDGYTATYAYALDSSTGKMISTTITNTKPYNLPTTGGSGTAIFLLLGATLALGAAFAFLIIRKRRKQGGGVSP